MFKKQRKFKGRLPDKNNISMELELDIHSPDGLYNNRKISKVKIEECGKVNTDTPLKDIKNVLEDLF